MKQLFFIFSFLAFGAMAAIAQHTGGPVMVFETTTIDYGTIEKGADSSRKFKFTNTGNEPLIISRAKGSCNCTVPSYPKDPIMPGETAYIGVTYDTQRVGNFSKQISLDTNEPDVSTHTLTIKGEVKSQPVKEPMPGGNGG